MQNNNKNNNQAIAVFDSGIGGLTVVKQLMELLPNENIIYFGDIARLPYGNKSAHTIEEFTKQTMQFLLTQNIKLIVIACNTIAAVAKHIVLNIAGTIPVVDVISAGVSAAINYDNIGIIATKATIKSNTYTNLIEQIDQPLKNKIITAKACPLFVPFIEEGLLTHPALQLIAQEYLSIFNTPQFIQHNSSCIIMACTHYPLIQNMLQNLVASHIKLIDPANITANTALSILKQYQLLNQYINNHSTPQYKFFVTEISDTFIDIGSKFLNHQIEKVNLIKFDV